MPGKVVVRPSEERGYANHGWLDTHHTFSFANYYDPNYEEFGALRVINEDIVQPQKGFGTHSHREFEIFSYIISGELEHKDSMGNLEILKRGDVQFTTAGTGISHSEHNVHKTLPVHFLQIWVKPDNPKLSPAYHTKTFSESAKENKLVRIISPDKKHVPDTIGIHTDFHMYASLLDQGAKVTHKVQGNANDGDNKRKLYIHVIEKEGMKVLINGESLLKHGDGAFITEAISGDEIIFESVGNRTAEFVIFDLV